MKKLKTSMILFQIILYSSSYVLTSTTGTNSLTTQRLPKHLIPNAQPAHNDGSDSDTDSIPPLESVNPTIKNAPKRTIPQIFTADSLMVTRNSQDNRESKSNRSLFSRFFNNVSNKTSELFFGKNIENEYWKIFDMDKKLAMFQSNISDEDACTRIITDLIQQISNQHEEAKKLLFEKYFKLDKEIMQIIEKYLAKGTKITAFPSSSEILITSTYAVQGNLSNVQIPPKDLSQYDPSYIKNIESTWLLNLHITYLDKNFMYAHFNYLKLSFNMTSIEEILKNTKSLQSNIHYLYEKDLDDLKERMDLLLNFIIEKLTNQTPEIDKILYSISYPNITEILFKNNTAEEVRKKTSTFTDSFNL